MEDPNSLLSRTNSNSTLNTDLIEEPVGDVFFAAAKNNVIKKLELEELKEELESAEYQEAYPESDNIYEDRSDPISFDSLEMTVVTSTEIIEKIKEKNKQIIETEKEYTEKKNANQLNPKYSNIILFVDTLNLYISNKEKLSSIIKNIHEEVQKGIPIRDNLDEIEKNDKNKEGTEKKNYLLQNWSSNFTSYERINKNLRELFNSIYDDKILNEHDKLYKILSTHKLFNTYGLFYKAIYDSEELTSLFNRLHKIVFEILKDYTRYNEYVKSIINPRTAVGNGVLGIYKKDNDKLEEENLRLNRELSQIKRVADLPNSGEKKRRQLRRVSKLNPEEKKRLNEKIENLKKEKDATIQKLKEELKELQSKQTTEEPSETKSTERENIEELNKHTEALIEQLAKKIAELTDAQKLVNIPKEEIESELQILESQDSGFLSLVINAADLYGKDEFKDSFEELLKYQPDDKFMFGVVFTKMEGDYKYLDEFLQNPDIIPEKIYEDALISEITKKITIPTHQTP